MIFEIPQGGRRGAGKGGSDHRAGSTGRYSIMKTLTKFAVAPVALGSLVVASAANAQTATLADLGAAADFADVKSVILTIAIAVFGVAVLMFGIRKARGSLRG